jgi:hypothetical protein
VHDSRFIGESNIRQYLFLRRLRPVPFKLTHYAWLGLPDFHRILIWRETGVWNQSVWGNVWVFSGQSARSAAG